MSRTRAGKSPRKAPYAPPGVQGPGTPRTAFAYLRVSTGEQARKYSLAGQRQQLQQYCQAQGIQVKEWFEDHQSGTQLVARQGLMELLDRAGEVGLVLATEADRISRDTFQFGWVATHLQMQGVELRLLNEKPAETPMEKAFQKIRAVFAEFETELRQWRIDRGRGRARAQNKFMSRPPLGYMILREALAVDPAGQAQVESLFRCFVGGASMAEAVWREVREISRLRGRHGYQLVREVRGAAIGAEAA